MKDSRTETQKLAHSFICVIVVLTSLTLIALGVFAAKNNTSVIESGISPAMIYAARENEEISIQIDKRLYQSKQKDLIPFDTLAALAPAPLGGLYLIYQNICDYVSPDKNKDTEQD